MSPQAHYHPFFFLLMALVAIAELAMTAFLINELNEQNHWPTPHYRSLCAISELSSRFRKQIPSQTGLLLL